MWQDDVWLVLGVFGASVPLVAFARRSNIPYPIVLVLGGLILGFIPGLPRVSFDPTVVLVVFLPALLYWESITAPTGAIRENASQIWLLAIGLVIATTIAVAVVVHSLIPNSPWAIAFVLGAIVAPTDELASEPVLARMRMPRHLIALVEGESLLNDAASLILYAVAVAAAVSGTFSFGRAAIGFIVSAVGGVLLGLLVARLATEAWRRIKDTPLQSVISITLPYLTYSIATRTGLSGVLGVVYAGFLANRNTPTVLTPLSRLRLTGFWETLVFLLNVVLFVTLGLQLHSVAQAVFAEYSVTTVLWYAFALNATIIFVRFAWILVQEYLPVIGTSSDDPSPNWKHAVIAAWSGLRGAVSLATALALPLTVAGGAHFPHRSLIVFLTFTVILVTLVCGGLTLPLAIRLLKADVSDDAEDEEIQRGLEGMSEAALAELETIEREGQLPPEHVASLRRRYDHQRKHAGGHPRKEDALFAAERRLIEAERAALVAMRERGEIDNTTLRRLQRTLDFSEERLR